MKDSLVLRESLGLSAAASLPAQLSPERDLYSSSATIREAANRINLTPKLM